MVVDTSAAMAVLLSEASRPSIEALLHGLPCRMSAATKVELLMVAEGRAGVEGGQIAQELLDRFEIEVVAVDDRQVRVAISGWRRYGKGRHAAGLNFGDCFSYALAIELDEPLLFVGDDFSQTDVVPALA